VSKKPRFKPPKFGPTGKFPDGMLGPDDKGGIQIGVAHDSKGTVIINFGKEVSWVGFPPEGAINLAKLLFTHAGATRVEVSFGESSEEVAISRDSLAKIIYDAEPHYEGGEYVDGIQVSPGRALSWEQAKKRDAEFSASGMLSMSITAFAFKCADDIIAHSPTNKGG
jgi:hypothetical protein